MLVQCERRWGQGDVVLRDTRYSMPLTGTIHQLTQSSSTARRFPAPATIDVHSNKHRQ